MSARGVLNKKAMASEISVREAVQGDLAVPPGAHEVSMIATIGTRPGPVLDNVREAERLYAKSNHVSTVTRIAIKAKGRILFVDPIDVVAAKAQGNYVALVRKSGSYLVRETMATAERKLTPFGFVRIHRSILVNATLVKDLRRDSTGTYVLGTTDGSEHPVGRAYKDNLKVIASSWLGVELL